MFVVLHNKVIALLAKFLTVGIVNTAIGLALIYSLKWGMGWGDASANLLAYTLCIFLGFLLNGRWTFGKSKLRAHHFLRYMLVMIVAYLMNFAVVMVSINMFNIHGDYAQLFGVPVFALTSFFLCRMMVFADYE
jgi:putative flippase GtrA